MQYMDFAKDVRDAVFNMRCRICRGYLFLMNVVESSVDRVEGTVYCPDCKQETKHDLPL
jgi:ribosomal protein L33